jgi:hypothetical protein
MSGIYLESLKHAFWHFETYLKGSVWRRRTISASRLFSLVDGEFITWEGKCKTVLSLVCFRLLNAAGWLSTTGRNWLPLDGRRAGPKDSAE